MVSRAQGTIEYLVILAIVVVISLVVVVTVTNFSGQSSVSQSTDKLVGQVGVEGISVVDAVADFDGSGLLSLKNNSSEVLTLKEISTKDGVQEYGVPWGLGITSLVDISGLCQCVSGEGSKVCELEIVYLSSFGLEKRVSQTITVECIENVQPNKPPVLPLNCFNLDDDPIRICSLTDLNRLRENLSGNYILMKDIDASETQTWGGGNGWVPIGTTLQNPFTGNLNGQNFTISNLFINNSGSSTGLFGFTNEPAIISNLKLKDLNVMGGGYTGALIGAMYAFNNNSKVENVHVSGNIKGGAVVGGIAGSSSGTIKKSSVNATITGADYVGGLVGAFMFDGLIEESFASIDLKKNVSEKKFGGLTGSASGIIRNSYATGIIDGTNTAGGLVGWLYNGEIINSYSNVELRNKDIFFNGGLVAMGSGSYVSIGTAENSFWDVDVSGYVFSYTGNSKITIEMKQQSTFVDWDFESVWVMPSNDYPKLAWE
jgi:hypothetical protein